MAYSSEFVRGLPRLIGDVHIGNFMLQPFIHIWVESERVARAKRFVVFKNQICMHLMFSFACVTHSIRVCVLGCLCQNFASMTI